MGFTVWHFRTEKGNTPTQDFLAKLKDEDAAGTIVADIELIAEHGPKAPASMRPVTAWLPIWEIRTGVYRTMYVLAARAMWVLEICHKRDEKRGYALAWKRWKVVGEWLRGQGK